MASPNQDWYGHLVAKSKTNDIYTLFRTHLTPDWEPNHHLDFVVVRQNALPERLRQVPVKHFSKKLPKAAYCFPGNDYVLLHNYHLTEYLHEAKWAAIIEDFEGRSFIELRFDWTNQAEENWNHPQAYQLARPPKPTANTTEAQMQVPESDEEMALIYAYQLLRDAGDKALTLSCARIGKGFLDTQVVGVGDQSDLMLQKIKRRMLGYNIIAMVAAWNNEWQMAAQSDEQYLHHPAVWDKLDGQIRSYLELLMIKGNADYLDIIFTNSSFRQRFLAHYEAHISLFVNPDYPLTAMREAYNIV